MLSAEFHCIIFIILDTDPKAIKKKTFGTSCAIPVLLVTRFTLDQNDFSVTIH